ncbi:MAG: glycosyltransferase family 1 protein [Sterolibacteriaceae bacterium MAG5]|nr:glycosyltransferase family 1 protein [Candidatus Nitricoxidireducens bremensis]
MDDKVSVRRQSGRPMRVALVTETYPPEVNGVAMTLGRMVDGLRRRGHAVHLVRPRQNDDESPILNDDFAETLVRGLPIPRYEGLRFGLPARDALVKAWRHATPDIVHVATEGPLGWSAINAARALGLPVSSGFHTNFDAYSRHYGFGWLRRPIAAYLRGLHNRTDATLVPTRGLSRELAAQGYRKLAVVSRGVDTWLFNPERRNEALRASWGAGPDDLVATYVGRLAPEKNLHLVLAAFAAIRAARPDARLVFVGEGPLLKPLSARHPEHIFAGLRRGADLAEHYASADLFLFPSLTETFGNVTAEALASGLGVVAYDCAAAADLIEDGLNGRLASPGDAAAFASAAAALAGERAELAQIRAIAAPSVAHLDWESIHDAFAAAIARTVATHKRRQHAENALVAALD